MKTYTIEELRLAQAKSCRIQIQLLDESWLTPDEPLQELLSHHLPIRIHPADEWKARRPIPGEFLHESELAKQPEAAQAPDFGEPWQPSCEMIFDRDGDYVAEFQPPFHDSSKVAARAIACTNALAGVPNPAEFVRQAKENAAKLADLERRQEVARTMLNHLESHS